MTAPRLEVDLDAITSNARSLVDLLAPRGIRVTGVTKATLGNPWVAAAMLAGGVVGLGDSRAANLARLREAGVTAPLSLLRSPALSQVGRAVASAELSLNTEAVVLEALSVAALRTGSPHSVVLMVELGDLREGIAVADVVDAARGVGRLPGLRLAGLGTNLACISGVVPDQRAMDELSRLTELVEADAGHPLAVVSGGNSANLAWVLATPDVGRINQLRLGEAILLGTEPLHRRAIEGLRTDAFALVAEVIEAKTKPTQPWGVIGQGAFGTAALRRGSTTTRQVIVALGRQDVDPVGLTPGPGLVIVGASSDHLVLDVGDHDVAVGDELVFGLDYSALVRAATSPFVHTVTSAPVVTAGSAA